MILPILNARMQQGIVSGTIKQITVEQKKHAPKADDNIYFEDSKDNCFAYGKIKAVTPLPSNLTQLVNVAFDIHVILF